MNIEQAIELKVGDTVQCPPDRGSPSYVGKVTQGAGNVCKNHQGREYVWITVRSPITSCGAVWPSNRISKL